MHYLANGRTVEVQVDKDYSTSIDLIFLFVGSGLVFTR